MSWKAILISAFAALLIAVLGSYLVVVSQNPASSVSGPAFEYGAPVAP